VGLSILQPEVFMSMSDDIEKEEKKVKAKVEAEVKAVEAEVKAIVQANPEADAGVPFYLNFFDDYSLSPIELEPDTQLEVRAVGLKPDARTLVSVKTTEAGRQYVSLKTFIDNIPGDIKEKEKVVVAELSLPEDATVGCTRYSGGSVQFQISVVEGEEGAGCRCVPFSLTKLAEACVMRFHAQDASKVDFIERAETFRNEVEWVVTAVQTPALTPAPAPAAAGKGTSTSALANAPATKFQPWTASVKSVEGTAEIFEVPPHQLYQIESRSPEGYISEGPALQQRYICCERSVEITSYFKPCGVRPVRSVVFVQQKCPGVRWGKNATVTIAGTEVPVGENGILQVPENLQGTALPISAPGVVLTPNTLDLSKPVVTVTVADQPVTASGRPVKGQFVDQAGKPFIRRPISVLLPDGDEIQVTTDDNGFFEAPQGSQVYAREDEFGMATEPLIVM
jgi:hypothetical protein